MVTAFPNESIDHLLKRFKVEVDRSGVLVEAREKEFFVSPSMKRHRADVDRKHLNKSKRKNFKSNQKKRRYDIVDF